VATVGFGCLILTEVMTRAAFDEKYCQTHGWPKHAGFCVAAALIYVFGLWLDRQPVLGSRRPGRIRIDIPLRPSNARRQNIDRL
jgi:hypothetical protein